MAVRLSRSTLRLTRPPVILGQAAVVGKKEGDGPLGKEFDRVNEDTTFDEATWEKSESRLQKEAVELLLENTGTAASSVELILAGDLLNQCVGSTYGLRSFGIPFLGLFGACSTMAEGLVVGSLLTESGMAQKIAAVTSSHFCTAERQFRFPLEYGGVRTPTSQWTVTGSGAVLLGNAGDGVTVTAATVGQIVDAGITDANNMGAAMAPAAASTIRTFFLDTGAVLDDYDAVVTGDLGLVGSRLLCELLEEDGIDLRGKHLDCGKMIFDPKEQDVHAGGSGCGCCASVLCGHFLPRLHRGEYKKILFCATGALMSPTVVQQGESIPGICHLVELTGREG